MMIIEDTQIPSNPLGIDGIEFIEYATPEPLALGSILEMMGFVQVARHRSREVVLYRQGAMNVIVNAAPEAWSNVDGDVHSTTISAIALRVRDAGVAYKRTVELGAWAIPTRAGAMELNIPGVHGVGDSIVYFVDRYRDFSIYDVDFRPNPNVDPRPPAIANMHFFGVVQAIRHDRTREWTDFYQQLMGFRVLPDGQYFGIVPKGTLLESPCRKFYLQLVEPPQDAVDVHWDEELIRVGIGAADVPEATRALQARGVSFADREPMVPNEKGALTQLFKGGVSFELVHSHLES
jgi:4-hydroxyphenylpyruvate dioxygenase